MTALDAWYHNQCLTALAKTHTNPKSEFNIEPAIGGIMMGELIIYIIWERNQTDTDVNFTRIKERLIKCVRPNSLQKVQQQGVLYTCRKFGRGYWLINQTHLDSIAVILAEATQIVNRWCPTPLSEMVHLIKSVQQSVLMKSLAFTNMMHRTSIADQSGHGYHCALLFNLMVLRLRLHLKILQLPIYSIYSLSGEGQKSGWTLQT